MLLVAYADGEEILENNTKKYRLGDKLKARVCGRSQKEAHQHAACVDQLHS